jgi:hypothetical protein
MATVFTGCNRDSGGSGDNLTAGNAIVTIDGKDYKGMCTAGSNTDDSGNDICPGKLDVAIVVNLSDHNSADGNFHSMYVAATTTASSGTADFNPQADCVLSAGISNATTDFGIISGSFTKTGSDSFTFSGTFKDDSGKTHNISGKGKWIKV